MAPPHTRTIGPIPLFYRLYFLYFEPFAALAGTYLCLFSPLRMLSGTLPLPAYDALALSSDSTIPPVLQMALNNIGALYVLFAIQEGVVLRCTKERSVWIAVMMGMCCCDLGHIYAVWRVWPERIWEVMAWNSDEWINYGTLIGGLTLRVLFLMGVGRS